MISKALFLCAVLGLVAAGTSPFNSRVKRQGLGIVGGLSEFPVADAETILSKTLLIISGGEKDTEIKVLKVHSAKSQVVAGALYKITADLSINGETKKKCVAEIFEQSWLEEEEGVKGGKTEISCPDGHKKSYTHTVAKRFVPGGIGSSSIEEATAALNKYLSGLVGGPGFTLVKINSETVQTVQGTLRKINADVKLENGDVETCDIDLWEKSWEENEKAVEIKFKCTKLGEKTLYSKYIK